MSCKGFEGGGFSLETPQMTYFEISLETGIAELALGILGSLEKALGELDAGTVKHSFGTAVLALVLIAQLIEDFAGELRRVASSSSQTEVSTTLESKASELWNVLLRYLPLFLVFLLLHDYGKRFIGDIVNSEVKFSDEQKALARRVLLCESSNRDPLNRQFLPSSPDEPNNLRQQLLKLFGKWTFEGMAATTLSVSSPEKTNSEQGLASESLGRVSVNLQELLASFKANLPNLGCDGVVPENDAEMAFRWLLILCHPVQSFFGCG